METFSRWSIAAVNLPEHADNPVHTVEGGLAAGYDGVAGVGAPLISHHHFVVLGEDIDELALGFVTPLQTDDAGSGHARPSRLRKH